MITRISNNTYRGVIEFLEFDIMAIDMLTSFRNNLATSNICSIVIRK